MTSALRNIPLGRIGFVAALPLFGGSLIEAPVSAQTIFAPVSAVGVVSGPGRGSIADVINQNGLETGYAANVTDFDAYIASNPLHTVNAPGAEWFANEHALFATVIFDMGSIKSIDRLALWNEESSGAGNVELYISSDNVGYTSFASFATASSDPHLIPYGAQTFSFAATTGRYVLFAMSDCPKISSAERSCSLGEIAFRNAVPDINAGVPEPASWAMMIGGFGMVGGAMRRRRQPQPVLA